mmetsp:Transcript_64134/g.198621  ORF Transcript_64134/g.198621 Transcript_64134/m.198621 type:complete len:226 (-) Transcript_64134:433-1110(-)
MRAAGGIGDRPMLADAAEHGQDLVELEAPIVVSVEDLKQQRNLVHVPWVGAQKQQSRDEGRETHAAVALAIHALEDAQHESHLVGLKMPLLDQFPDGVGESCAVDGRHLGARLVTHQQLPELAAEGDAQLPLEAVDRAGAARLVGLVQAPQEAVYVQLDALLRRAEGAQDHPQLVEGGLQQHRLQVLERKHPVAPSRLVEYGPADPLVHVDVELPEHVTKLEEAH